MLGVNRYYKGVERDIEVDPTTRFGADGDHAVVLVGRMQKPTLKALDYAIAARHESIEAVHCSIDDDGSEVITVYIPQYIVGHWWENLLHNHKARRIRRKLLLCHGVTVALVPWLLDSSSRLYARPKRPLPGQDRRGEPVRRAVVRKPIREPERGRGDGGTSPVDRQPAGKK